MKRIYSITSKLSHRYADIDVNTRYPFVVEVVSSIRPTVAFDSSLYSHAMVEFYLKKFVEIFDQHGLHYREEYRK